MEKKDILEKVQTIFRDIRDNEDIVLSEMTTANDIEEWDSLSHIQLIVAIEKAFGIKFTSYEVNSWIDMEEMLECIMKKLNK